MALKLNKKYLAGFVGEDELTGIASQTELAAKTLHDKTGLGNDFLGWVNLPTDYDKEEFARIQAAAKRIQEKADVLIVIGIGGSYLGARAAIELLKSPFYNNMKKDTPDIYYVGNNINQTYLNEVLAICEGRDIAVNVISKSGTTTERHWHSRIFKNSWRTSTARKAQRKESSAPPTQSAAPSRALRTPRATRGSSSRTTSADASPF